MQDFWSTHCNPHIPYHISKISDSRAGCGLNFWQGGLDMWQVGLDLWQVSLDLWQVGLDLRQVGLDLWQVGFDLQQVGLDLWQNQKKVALSAVLKLTATRNLQIRSLGGLRRTFPKKTS